jgi:hypothetical protein
MYKVIIAILISVLAEAAAAPTRVQVIGALTAIIEKNEGQEVCEGDRPHIIMSRKDKKRLEQIINGKFEGDEDPNLVP